MGKITHPRVNEKCRNADMIIDTTFEKCVSELGALTCPVTNNTIFTFH